MRYIGQGGSCVLVVVLVFGLGAGCCWLSKRSCYPACEKPLPPKVVTVEKTCELPPLRLPNFDQAADCPEDRVCFDRENAGNLYLRLARLKDFAKEARARCDPPEPTSRPSSRPAASQPSR